MTYSIESNTFSGTFTSISIDANDVLTIDYDDTAAGEGTGTITIRATDTGALFIEDEFDVTVSAAGVDNPPTVVNAIADVSHTNPRPNTVIDLRLVFDDDIDADDEMSYSFSFVVTFGPGTLDSIVLDANDVLTINYNGGPSGEGTATVRVTATDTGLSSTNEEFDITIG